LEKSPNRFESPIGGIASKSHSDWLMSSMNSLMALTL